MAKYEVILHVTAPDGFLSTDDTITIGDVAISNFVQAQRLKMIDLFGVNVTVESVEDLDVENLYYPVLGCPCCKGFNVTVLDDGKYQCLDDDVIFESIECIRKS